jgi:hypothetical protein
MGWNPVSVQDPCIEQNGPFEVTCFCAGMAPTTPGAFIGQVKYTGCQEMFS